MESNQTSNSTTAAATGSSDIPAKPTTDPCLVELTRANQCVTQMGSTKCSCLEEPFLSMFPTSVENVFVQNMAENGDNVNDPTLFCKSTDDKICNFLQSSVSCCCQKETADYTACTYAKDIVVRYEAYSNCTYSSCVLEVHADPGMGGGLSSLGPIHSQNRKVYGVLLSILLLIVSILYYFFCWRKKRTIKKEKDIVVNVNCTSTENVTEHHMDTYQHHESRTARITTTKKKKYDDNDSDCTDDFDWGKFKENDADDDCDDDSRSALTRQDIETRKESSSRDMVVRNSRELATTTTKKNNRERGKNKELELLDKDDNSNSKQLVMYDDKKSSRLREKRRQIEHWYQEEKLRLSDRSLMSETEEDESSDTRRERRKSKKKRKDKKKKKKRNRHRDDYENEDDASSVVSSSNTVEESIRKARTILGTVNTNVNNIKNNSKTVVTLIPALKEVIDLLEGEKKKLRDRQKQIDEEKMRLTMEVQESKEYLAELQDSKKIHDIELAKAKLGKDLVAVQCHDSLVGISNEINHKQQKDMEVLKEDMEEMTALLTMLKQAQAAIEQQIQITQKTKHALHREKEEIDGELALAKIMRAEERKQVEQAYLDLTDLGVSVEDTTISMMSGTILSLDDHDKDEAGQMQSQKEASSSLESELYVVNDDYDYNNSVLSSSIVPYGSDEDHQYQYQGQSRHHRGQVLLDDHGDDYIIIDDHYTVEQQSREQHPRRSFLSDNHDRDDHWDQDEEEGNYLDDTLPQQEEEEEVVDNVDDQVFIFEAKQRAMENDAMMARVTELSARRWELENQLNNSNNINDSYYGYKLPINNPPRIPCRNSSHHRDSILSKYTTREVEYDDNDDVDVDVDNHENDYYYGSGNATTRTSISTLTMSL